AVALPILGDVLVEVRCDALLHQRCSSVVQSDWAVVELGDPHARRLTLTGRQPALLVGGVDEHPDGGAHLGPHGPHHGGVTAVALRDVDARHGHSLRGQTWSRTRSRISSAASMTAPSV